MTAKTKATCILQNISQLLTMDPAATILSRGGDVRCAAAGLV